MSKTNPGGTMLNNESLEQDARRELNNNDVIQVCGRRFLFTQGASCSHGRAFRQQQRAALCRCHLMLCTFLAPSQSWCRRC